MIKTGVKSQVLIFSSKPFLRGCVMDNICRQCLMVGGLYVVSGEREGELT